MEVTYNVMVTLNILLFHVYNCNKSCSNLCFVTMLQLGFAVIVIWTMELINIDKICILYDMNIRTRMTANRQK